MSSASHRLGCHGGGDCLLKELEVVEGASPTFSPVAGSTMVFVGPDVGVIAARRAS
jgi:hypothetical protein